MPPIGQRRAAAIRPCVAATLTMLALASDHSMATLVHLHGTNLNQSSNLRAVIVFFDD